MEAKLDLATPDGFALLQNVTAALQVFGAKATLAIDGEQVEMRAARVPCEADHSLVLVERLGDPARKIGKSIDCFLAPDSDLDIEPRRIRGPMLLFSVNEIMTPKPDVEIVARLPEDSWLKPVLQALHRALKPVIAAIEARPLN